MEAAVCFYTSLIPGSSVTWTLTLPAETPSGPAGRVKLAVFTIGDQRAYVPPSCVPTFKAR
jgi:predicted 3-demethylubiquinone-9 3-methyltransferase (glyoxalase superfamily)